MVALMTFCVERFRLVIDAGILVDAGAPSVVPDGAPVPSWKK